MPAEIRYFVKTYLKQPGGELIQADNLELPNEEAALYAASVCIMDKAGAAVVALEGEAGQATRLLHSYGSVPTRMASEAEPSAGS